MRVDGNYLCKTAILLSVCPKSGTVSDVPLWG